MTLGPAEARDVASEPVPRPKGELEAAAPHLADAARAGGC